MAERRGHDRSVQFEHAFDRLLAVKLEQVYGILVPEWVRAIGVDQSVRGKRDESCRDLHQSIFRTAETGPRQKVTKPFRLSGRAVHGDKSSSHERPRDQWIEIPVPAIVSDDTFALAAERLADNKRFAPRRTIEPSIVQGLVSCRKCGYALSRTSARTSARKIHYYRCLGSDAWRHLGGPVCDSR